MENIIEIERATVYRGPRRVLNDFSLTIPVGCHTVILGPNGSGKSTLLKLLAREVYPAAENGASVRIFGGTDWNLWELRSRLGIISSDLQSVYAGDAMGLEVILSGLYASMGVWPNQTFTDKEREKALAILDSFGVAHLAQRSYEAMSTGEQRRLLLGRALINEPQALVLDEPTSGLDVQACLQYLDIVRGLIRAGKTIVLVTHHLHEIPKEVSRIVLLKSGKIIADGEKEEVLTSEVLTHLYGIPLRVHFAAGSYWVAPQRD